MSRRRPGVRETGSAVGLGRVVILHSQFELCGVEGGKGIVIAHSNVTVISTTSVSAQLIRSFDDKGSPIRQDAGPAE